MPPRGPSRPLTDADRAEIIRRCRAGEARNHIAREVHRSGSTVSSVVTKAGLTFERGPEVIAATTAKVVDLAGRRATMAVRLHDEAERELDLLRAPTLYWDWGGKDHTYDDKLVDQPIATDRRAIMATVSVALDRSLKLVPPKDDPADAARSMVGQLMAGLAQVYREQEATGEAGDAE